MLSRIESKAFGLAVGSAGSASTTPVAGMVPLFLKDRLNCRGSPGRIVGSCEVLTPLSRANAGCTVTFAQALAAADPMPLPELVAVPSAQLETPPLVTSSSVTWSFSRPWMPRVATAFCAMVPRRWRRPVKVTLTPAAVPLGQGVGMSTGRRRRGEGQGADVGVVAFDDDHGGGGAGWEDDPRPGQVEFAELAGRGACSVR